MTRTLVAFLLFAFSLVVAAGCTIDADIADNWGCQSDDDCIAGYRCVGLLDPPEAGNLPEGQRYIGRCFADEEVPVLGCVDEDGDGFFVELVPGGCPAGFAEDCDDTDPLIFPGADEQCDGIDRNCNGHVDCAQVDDDGNCICTLDGGPDGTCLSGLPPQLCGLQAGVCAGARSYCIDGFFEDCNDVYIEQGYVGTEDVCDGLDSNCNGIVDSNGGTAGEVCDCNFAEDAPQPCNTDAGVCSRGLRFCLESGQRETRCIEAPISRDECESNDDCGELGFCVTETYNYLEDALDGCRFVPSDPDQRGNCTRRVCRSLRTSTGCTTAADCGGGLTHACVEGTCRPRCNSSSDCLGSEACILEDPTGPPKEVPPVSSGPGTGSGSGEPGTGEPGSGEPGSGEPGTGEPGTGEPGTGEPGTGEPGTGEPGSGEPGTGEPGSGEPGSGEPGTGEPGSGEPGSGEPSQPQEEKNNGSDPPAGTDEPPATGTPTASGAPGTDEPGETGEPGTDEPGETGEPGTDEPGASGEATGSDDPGATGSLPGPTTPEPSVPSSGVPSAPPSSTGPTVPPGAGVPGGAGVCTAAAACSSDDECHANEVCLYGYCQFRVVERRAPSQETCNGLDDTCTGRIDNGLDPTVCGSCPFNMVRARFRDPQPGAAQSSICVDKYEASRPDATARSAGRVELYSVSRPGVLPWTNLTREEAAVACRGDEWRELFATPGAQAGPVIPNRRLCTRTQWVQACSGFEGSVDERRWPYFTDALDCREQGDAFCNSQLDGDGWRCINNRCQKYLPGRCNDATTSPDGVAPTGSFPECVRDVSLLPGEANWRPQNPDGSTYDRQSRIYDQSGNVAEWVSAGPGLVMGGSYLSTTGEQLRCDAEETIPVDSQLDHVGFRCCTGTLDRR